jgi:hypothetical protein
MMPRILPGSPGLLFEFGASARVPPRAWFQTPPPRDVDVADLVRTSYASSTGKGLVGIGLLLGVPLLVIGILAMATDPWHIVTATLGGLFAAFLVVIPALPAIRFARALRFGVIDHATVTANPNAARRGVRIVDRRGRIVPFDPVMMWRTKLRVGADIELLVDPERDRVLWILGPADETWPVSDDPPGSRTMPGQ